MADIQMQPISSSMIAQAGYEEDSHVLRVEFSDGAVFEYDGVPAAVGRGIFQASSAGRYWHAEIKGRYTHRRV